MDILSWWSIATVSVIVGAITVLVAVGHRSRTRASSEAVSTAALRVTRVIAGTYAAASVIGTVAGASHSLWSESVNVRLPVEPFWPSLPSTVQVEGTTADVVGGGFDHAMVVLTGLDSATRVWLSAGDVLQGLTNVVIGVVMVVLCTSIIRQNPFRPALTRSINVTATVIIIGGLGWQVCDAVAGGLASEQVLGATGWSLDTAQVDWKDVRQLIGLPGVGQEWTVNFWPIWVGLALFAVAAVFRYGQKMHKDTQGLI